MAKKKKILHKTPIGVGGSHIDEIDALKMMVMTTMSEMGITPEEYDRFLKSDINKDKIKESMLSLPFDQPDFDFDDDDAPKSFLQPRPFVDTPSPMPDADNKSLRIKVQMKDVSKPPMWRELVIPADFNFSQLHYAIQAATGLMNCHLWQFQRQAYNPDLQIGIPADDSGYGLDEWTHDANETAVTSFLAKKGDKLEYVYDFGDDWIFTVSVLEVMERHGEVAELTKWKCDMQPIEDCGGVYAYLQLRDIQSSPGSLNQKMKSEIAENYGFEDFDMFAAWLDEANIDVEFIQEQLSEIPDKFEDTY